MITMNREMPLTLIFIKIEFRILYNEKQLFITSVQIKVAEYHSRLLYILLWLNIIVLLSYLVRKTDIKYFTIIRKKLPDLQKKWSHQHKIPSIKYAHKIKLFSFLHITLKKFFYKIL